MAKVRRDILQTFSGQIINIDNPKADTIRIEDIAKGLSNIKRFSGQIDLTVAAHSLAAATSAKWQGFGPRRQLYALLHDAAEAYYGDMPSPLKLKIRSFKKYENKLLNVILHKYLKESCLAHMPKWLKTIDDQLLHDERTLFFDPAFCRAITHISNKLTTSIDLRCRFLNVFNDLYRKIYLEGDEHVRTEKLSD